MFTPLTLETVEWWPAPARLGGVTVYRPFLRRTKPLVMDLYFLGFNDFFVLVNFA